MDLAYLAVVALGAVTLVLEASRQFSVPVNVHPHDRYPILKGVELEALCTNAELIRGFLIYASIYLGAYGTILTSAELYDLITSSDPTGKVVGAKGDIIGPKDDSVLGDLSGYGKPIFVSAIIIAALTAGIFAPIERTVRSYSHRIAGIPRGVYRIISRLHRIEYTTLSKNFQLPLRDNFNKKVTELFPDSENNDLVMEIQDALQAIDLISPSVTGQLRDQIFPSFRLPIIDELINKQAEAQSNLKLSLQARDSRHGATTWRCRTTSRKAVFPCAHDPRLHPPDLVLPCSPESQADVVRTLGRPRRR